MTAAGTSRCRTRWRVPPTLARALADCSQAVRAWREWRNASCILSYNITPGVDLFFAQSAFKHGVTKAQIEFVVAHCGLVFGEPAPAGSSIPDDRSLYLGDDEHGMALEVVAIAWMTNGYSSSVR